MFDYLVDHWVEWIGWAATAVFALSYFCRQPTSLRRVQALAALLWIGYGVIIKAPPVIVANVVVAVMALLSSFRGRAQHQPRGA
ncbi:MAG: YgjV family protein [Acidobacteria bacterium]|nr:YgjV family protein [Acidobacteriota bacterium]MBI3427396.1 YgjV family protein [Acidobacteriota bacterium]